MNKRNTAMKRRIPLLAAAVLLLCLPSCRFVRVSDEIKQEYRADDAAGTECPEAEPGLSD